MDINIEEHRLSQLLEGGQISDDKINREILSLHKGEQIIVEGVTPKGVYIIKSGTVKLYKVGFNGKEQILRFLKKGDLIGYRSLLCCEPFGASAVAMESMEVVYFTEDDFLKLLKNDASLAFDILHHLAKELGEAARTITFLAQKTVRERLAEVFLLLEQKLGVDAQGYINISLTREEVANLVGTATESAIRLISEFRTDELIEVNGRKIKILNHEKLTKLGHVKL